MCFYHDRRRLALDLGDSVNREIRALVDAGCRHIQVNGADDATGMGGLGAVSTIGVTRTVHICCSYPDHLDDGLQKADAASYHRLAGVMDNFLMRCRSRTCQSLLEIIHP